MIWLKSADDFTEIYGRFHRNLRPICFLFVAETMQVAFKYLKINVLQKLLYFADFCDKTALFLIFLWFFCLVSRAL